MSDPKPATEEVCAYLSCLRLASPGGTLCEKCNNTAAADYGIDPNALIARVRQEQERAGVWHGFCFRLWRDAKGGYDEARPEFVCRIVSEIDEIIEAHALMGTGDEPPPPAAKRLRKERDDLRALLLLCVERGDYGWRPRADATYHTRPSCESAFTQGVCERLEAALGEDSENG